MYGCPFSTSYSLIPLVLLSSGRWALDGAVPRPTPACSHYTRRIVAMPAALLPDVGLRLLLTLLSRYLPASARPASQMLPSTISP